MAGARGGIKLGSFRINGFWRLAVGFWLGGIGFVSYCRGRSGVVEKGSRGEDNRRNGEEIGFVSHFLSVGGGSGQAGGAGVPRRWNRGVKLMEARFACDSFCVDTGLLLPPVFGVALPQFCDVLYHRCAEKSRLLRFFCRTAALHRLG